MFTRRGLRRALRACHCTAAKAHARRLVDANRLLRCREAHPPTAVDEVAATQAWFAKARPSDRRTFALCGGRWNGGPSGPVGLSDRRWWRRQLKAS